MFNYILCNPCVTLYRGTSMSDLLKMLTNVRSLRVLARETSLEQLEIALEKFSLVVEEKREAEAKAEREIAERQARIAKLKESLIQEGITAQELAILLGQESQSQRKKENLAQQNTNISMKMVKKELGLVKVEHQKSFKKPWMRVNP